MAIKILTRTLGKIVEQLDETFLVRIRGQENKTFDNKEDAQAYFDKKAPKRYIAGLWVKGKLRWKSFGTKKSAEAYLADRTTARNKGTYIEIKKCNFEEYVRHWKETYLFNLKPSTLNGYLCCIEKRLIPEFGDRRLQDIDAGDINKFKARMFSTESKRKRNLKSGTVRNTLNLLSKIFDDAIADGRLQISPMAQVQVPKLSKEKSGRALNPEEIADLLANCEEKQTYLIVLMAVTTGMRRGELFGLRWEDIDFDNDVIHVKQSLYRTYGKYNRRKPDEVTYKFVTPKSETSVRDIDLSPALKRALMEAAPMDSSLVAPKGLVFCGETGQPLDPDNFSKRSFAQAVMAADIGHIRFHDLRHTYGSLKIAQGEDVYYVQRQMGHSSIQVTVDVYGHLLRKRNAEAAKRTDDLIFNPKKTAK